MTSLLSPWPAAEPVRPARCPSFPSRSAGAVIWYRPMANPTGSEISGLPVRANEPQGPSRGLRSHRDPTRPARTHHRPVPRSRQPRGRPVLHEAARCPGPSGVPNPLAQSRQVIPISRAEGGTRRSCMQRGPRARTPASAGGLRRSACASTPSVDGSNRLGQRPARARQARRLSMGEHRFESRKRRLMSDSAAEGGRIRPRRVPPLGGPPGSSGPGDSVRMIRRTASATLRGLPPDRCLSEGAAALC